MSNAYVKKHEPHYSAERRAPASDVANHRRPGATRRPKPYKIETRWTLFDADAPWTIHKRYATAEARDEALRRLKRSRIRTFVSRNGENREWGHSIDYR